MRCRRRLTALGHRLPPARPAGIPTDPAALLAGLAAGTVTMADFDRTDPGQVSALAYAAALAISRLPVGGPP